MKTFSKIAGIIVGIAIAVVIGYAAYRVGIPYLFAKTEYDRNRPTIYQTSQKSSVAIQKKIQSQLENIETRISNGNESASHEPNGRK